MTKAKTDAIGKTRLIVTTNLRRLRAAEQARRITYRQYMEIAKALGGARVYGRETTINLRWIVDTFPRYLHVDYIEFCEGERTELMRQLLHAFCVDMLEEYELAADAAVAEMASLHWSGLKKCLAYLESALADDKRRFSSETTTSNRLIERNIGEADRRFCKHVCAFLITARKQTNPAPADFDSLYPIFIDAVNSFHGAMTDGHLIDTLKNRKAPKAWELMRRALLTSLKASTLVRKKIRRGRARGIG